MISSILCSQWHLINSRFAYLLYIVSLNLLQHDVNSNECNQIEKKNSNYQTKLRHYFISSFIINSNKLNIVHNSDYFYNDFYFCFVIC